MLNVVMLSVVMLSVVMLNVLMLNVFMLSVVVLSVVAPVACTNTLAYKGILTLRIRNFYSIGSWIRNLVKPVWEVSFQQYKTFYSSSLTL
jgi:hypothetical protein